MCGAEVPPQEAPVPPLVQQDVEAEEVPGEPAAVEAEAVEPAPPAVPEVEAASPEVFEAVLRERQSPVLTWLTIIISTITIMLALLIWRNPDGAITLALVPTLTPIPPTSTHTATPTAVPTETPQPTATPTLTPTPAPTDTPQPARFHTVAGGETIFGLSLLYRISADSIADSNGLGMNAPIQVGQQLTIPWPTATPPLESLVLEVNGESIIADATDCQIVALQEGDSIYGLSAQYNVPAEAIIAVNRLTDETMVRLFPGDTLCIPQVVYSDTLPPTPGPQPTVTATSFPAGPELLYPVNEDIIDPPDGLLTLQWVAVKDLAPDEWYMVEMTDLDVLDALPKRGFTRDTSFQVPSDWRPVQPETHRQRWRVSIVKVTGERTDGAFIYTFGGRASPDNYFYWLGAPPTPTPTATATPSPTPISD